MLRRVLSALVLIPIVLLITYVGGAWFWGLVALGALLAAVEYYRLLSLGGYRPLAPLGLALIVVFLLDALFPGYRLAAGGLALCSMGMMVWQVFQGNAPGSWADWAVNLAGAVYIGWSAHHFVLLRGLPQGLNWIILLFAITWICDSAALFIGRAYGKHPFFPKISPKKTREGAIAGLVGGTLAALAFGLPMGLAWYHAILLGFLVSLSSTFGDLSESVLKRQVSVKDSGNLIPGHGGMLDRVDSLLFNVIVLYYYLYWILGIGL